MREWLKNSNSTFPHTTGWLELIVLLFIYAATAFFACVCWRKSNSGHCARKLPCDIFHIRSEKGEYWLPVLLVMVVFVYSKKARLYGRLTMLDLQFEHL